MVMLVAGALFLCKVKKDQKEFFSNENSYKLLFPGIQFTSSGRPFLNVPGEKNVLKVEPTRSFQSQSFPNSSTEFYSRPTYNTSPMYRTNPDGTMAQTRGRAAKADGPFVATFSSLEAMRLANLAETVSEPTPESGTSNGDPIYQDPLKYIPTSELLVQPNISAMTNGKDPRDAKNFMYHRNIFVNQKRRGWEGGCQIRGDLEIAPDNKGWFQVNAHAHLDLRRGALQHISDGKYDTYDTIGPDIRTTTNLKDTSVENMIASGKSKLLSPAAFNYKRLS
jgi:hypothetical protein